MDGYIRRFSYDGTLEGFLCTALRILRVRTMPDEIIPDYLAEITDERCTAVRTNAAEAEYLYSLIGRRGSAELQQMVSDFFLTCVPDKEKLLFEMIYRALRDGGSVAEDYSSDVMRRVHMAIRDLYREAQAVLPYIEFFRGEEASCAVIDPHNLVLPLIRKPVLKRNDLDDLIVFDRRHCLMLGRRGANDMLTDIRQISLKMPDTASEAYDILWPAVKEAKFDVRFAGSSTVISGRRSDFEPLWSMAQ
jgi:probable DNA metabolism protein